MFLLWVLFCFFLFIFPLYWFRWLLTLIQSVLKKKINLDEIVETHFICTPDQLDFNIHMNNSHFFTSMEFSRTEFLLRANLWQKLTSIHCTLMIGGLSFQFRRQISLFQRYKIITKILGWYETFLFILSDSKWMFVEHIFKTTNNQFIGKGILRIGIVDKKTNKLVPAFEKMKEFESEELVDKLFRIGSSNECVESFKSHDKHLGE
jgi:acyl-CoA thioesterase FadM